MLLRKIVQRISEILPPQTAMQGDKIGLQIQSGNNKINSLLFCLEVTEKVVSEAIANNNDCIIAFHPLIWMPLSYIDNEDRVGKITTLLIQNSISLITVHTTFDSYLNGTSKILSDLLGLEYIDFLIKDKEVPNCGMGIVAKNSANLSIEQLTKKISNICGSPVRLTQGKNETIDTIAIVGGSGTSFVQDVLDKRIDAFITADITYHQFHSVKGKLWLFDPGHYEMEQFVAKHIALLFEKDEIIGQGGLKFQVTRQVTNPVEYYPNNKNYILKQKFNLEN